MLDTRLAFVPEAGQDFFDSIPSRPAVFSLRGDEGAEPYVSKTSDLKRRLLRLLSPAEPGSKRLNLRDRVRSLAYSITGSDFESGFLLYRTLREEFPDTYRDRLKLRFAPLVKLNLENPFPRAYVTRRIGKLRGASRYYGPFASRAAAERFLNDSLDFFKMRRCDFELNPDPNFPGCVYSEMKMCLAPCFRGCSDEEYKQEVSRVQDYLETGGESLLRELGAERERASEALQFENAAALHGRAEKVKALTGQATLPEIVRPIDRLNGVMVQPSAEPESVSIFRVDTGCISAPAAFCVSTQPELQSDEKQGKPRSMESRVAEFAAAMPVFTPHSAAELCEHIALLRRWYYRSRKVGELFLHDTRGELPLRRVVRGIGRVYRGEKETADTSFAQS